ncbi:hypothetical protein IW262DRAFT_481476 [Armillaria fumosa]|nr:hypothetical protein IW262DRAFT_481476 [Armillaria fumosa]
MMATSRRYQPSSPYSLQHPSPLEALGRRQNIPQPVRLPPAHSLSSSRLNPQFTYPIQNSSGSSINHLTTPPSRQPQHPGHHLTPSSPLLHSHFSRGSTATRLACPDRIRLASARRTHSPCRQSSHPPLCSNQQLLKTRPLYPPLGRVSS